MGRPRRFALLAGAAAAAVAVVRHGRGPATGTACREASSSAMPSSMTG
jgi:hypothetical protein